MSANVWNILKLTKNVSNVLLWKNNLCCSILQDGACFKNIRRISWFFEFDLSCKHSATVHMSKNILLLNITIWNDLTKFMCVLINVFQICWGSYQCTQGLCLYYQSVRRCSTRLCGVQSCPGNYIAHFHLQSVPIIENQTLRIVTDVCKMHNHNILHLVRKNYDRYMSMDIIWSKKQAVFQEWSTRKTWYSLCMGCWCIAGLLPALNSAEHFYTPGWGETLCVLPKIGQEKKKRVQLPRASTVH